MKWSTKRWRAVASVVALNLVFVAGLALLPRHSWIRHFWADIGWTLASLGCTVELFSVTRRLPPSRERSAWLWFSIGSFCWFIGMPAWSWLELIRGEVAPVARIADLGFIGMAPCFIVGIICLRSALPERHCGLLCACELGIAVSLILLLGGALLYHPIRQFAGSPRYLAASLSRAVVYSATALFAAMSIAQGRIAIHPRVASLLFGSFGAFAGLYVAFAYTLVTNRYETGAWLDAIWIVAFSLLFLAGFKRGQLGPQWSPATAGQPKERPYSMVWLWGALLFSFGAGVATFWGDLTGDVRFLLIVLGALTLFVAVRSEIHLAEERDARGRLHHSIRLREDFLALAAHELRTPLMPLNLRLTMLRRSIESAPLTPDRAEELKSSLAIGERQVDRLRTLVDDLLEVASLESGTLTLKREDVDLAALVRDQVDRYEDSLRRANCRLSIEEESAPHGSWDRHRIEQVVSKLLSNAIKFGAGKPIEIGISRRDDRAHLEVRDHGIGIAREDQERIFGKLERAAPVWSYGGLGLGLFITHQIVRSHGGTFRLESVPGQGAGFIVELPASPPGN